MAKPEKHVLVCMNSRPPGHPRGSCGSAGANEVLFRFQQAMIMVGSIQIIQSLLAFKLEVYC